MAQAHALRRGHPGRGFSQALIDKALRLRKRGNQASWKSISEQIGAFSPNTPKRWATKDMSANARASRLKNCGHRRLLSEVDAVVAAGWFISREIRHLTTTAANSREFFKSAFNLDVLPSWLSKFADRHHLSTRFRHRRQGEKFRKMHADQLAAFKKWAAVTHWHDPQEKHSEQLTSNNHVSRGLKNKRKHSEEFISQLRSGKKIVKKV